MQRPGDRDEYSASGNLIVLNDLDHYPVNAFSVSAQFRSHILTLNMNRGGPF